MKKRVIDAHLHLDSGIEGPAINATQELNNSLAQNNIEKGVVLHLQVQRWPVEEVAEALTSSDRLVGMVNVHPFQEDAEQALCYGIEELGFIGLKLHPRLQEYPIADPRVAKLVGLAGEMNVPVVIDAFPDGDWLMQGFDPLDYARLAKACPNTRIQIAHFGGQRCIDMMLLAKRLPNVSLDLSFSLLYFRGSSVVGDILYGCKSMGYSRVLYGSDYPDRSIGDSLNGSLVEFEKADITGNDLDRLLYANAQEFYGWSE
ncbi:MAG: amidohydrolase family protein [Rhodospirillales bacterium]|nr:amidohydrolase family protein [Rhodospirillales bacterium]